MSQFYVSMSAFGTYKLLLFFPVIVTSNESLKVSETRFLLVFHAVGFFSYTAFIDTATNFICFPSFDHGFQVSSSFKSTQEQTFDSI